MYVGRQVYLIYAGSVFILRILRSLFLFFLIYFKLSCFLIAFYWCNFCILTKSSRYFFLDIHVITYAQQSVICLELQLILLLFTKIGLSERCTLSFMWSLRRKLMCLTCNSEMVLNRCLCLGHRYFAFQMTDDIRLEFEHMKRAKK